MVISVGIHNRSQLPGLRTKTFLGRRRKFALDLLEEIEQQGNELIWEAFVESTVDGRGVSKRTYSNRFPEFDSALIECLQNYVPANAHFLDTAVSDGSTALELFNQIESRIGRAFRFTATDRDSNYKIISYKNSAEQRVVISQDGEIIQVIYPPFIFDSVPSRDNLFLFPINRAARPFFMRSARILVKKRALGDPEVEERALIFMSKRFREALQKDGRFNFVHWDITAPWQGEKVHCLRAMNILNPGYFSAPQLRHIIQNLVNCLVEGGILAVGSNAGPSSKVDGAIYRLIGGRLVNLASSGNGPRCRHALNDFVET